MQLCLSIENLTDAARRESTRCVGSSPTSTRRESNNAPLGGSSTADSPFRNSVFLLGKSSDNSEHSSTFYSTRAGSEPEPSYSLRHANPATSKNCYAVALFDPYNADVLFGEVLLRPQWTHSTLSQDEIRRNGGVPPPPEPVLPHDFTIQLYNPDQQVTVMHKQPALLGSAHWDFSMPQDTFRPPSSSILDLSRSDPGAAATTPRINFSWKKEKLSKDLCCFMTGKSTDVLGKKRNKEPDIAIAVFKSAKELTVYEPNLYRVELEDPKGLEVVLLLTAAVIRDVFYGNIKHAFNISEIARNSIVPIAADKEGLIESGKQVVPPVPSMPIKTNSAAAGALYQRRQTHPNAPSPTTYARPPPADPRTQWAIDNETARLKAQANAEERERHRVNELRRKERERQSEEETKRLRRMVEQEDQDRRQKQLEVDRETERLRKIYGQEGSGNTPNLPYRPAPAPQGQIHSSHSTPSTQAPFRTDSPLYMSGANGVPLPTQYPPQPQRLPNGLYMQPTQYYNNPPNTLRPNNTGPGPSWDGPRGSPGIGGSERPKKKSSTVW